MNSRINYFKIKGENLYDKYKRDARESYRKSANKLTDEKILKKYGKDNIAELSPHDWGEISIRYKLTEDFIRKFKDNVNWSLISEYQKISESFIREFKDDVDWHCISVCHKLSEDFM
jgi:hypothetical protein